MYSKRCLLIAIIAPLLQMVVDGFSTGAAGCGPAPSVGGVHLAASDKKTVNNYAWNTGLKPVVLKLGGTIISPGGTFTVKAKSGAELSVEGIEGNRGIKGVLFRFSADSTYDPDGTILEGAALPGESTKSAGACKLPVIGVTHLAGNDKPKVSAILNLPNKVGNIALDVTVVFFNSDTVSQYTNSTYTINVTGCKESIVYPNFLARLFRRNGRRVCK